MDFKNDLYECVTAFRKLPMSLLSKTHCLGVKLGEYEDNWQVVGVSKNALERFKAHDFRMVSRMGVHRAHKIDRKESYECMIEKDMDVDTLWNYYLSTNETILATATENMGGKGIDSTVYKVSPNLGLFKGKRVSWTHSKAEIEFLRNLFEVNEI